VALLRADPDPDVDMSNNQGSSHMQSNQPIDNKPPDISTHTALEDPIISAQARYQHLVHQNETNVGRTRVTRSSSRLALPTAIPEVVSTRDQKRRAAPSESSNVSSAYYSCIKAYRLAQGRGHRVTGRNEHPDEHPDYDSNVVSPIYPGMLIFLTLFVRSMV
jgi:hypothetical protein